MKKGKISKLVLLMLSVFLVFSIVLAGCGSAKNKVDDKAAVTAKPVESESAAKATAKPKLDPVVLTWYFGGTPQADVASVEAEMNKILQEKLNVTLRLKAVDWGNYEQKMQLINASGEEYDLAFTSNWMNNYYQNVNKGVYVPLDDLLQKYAPTIMATIPKGGWIANKVNGKIYAVPNYQIWARTDVAWPTKELADKYSLDVTKVKGIKDLTPFLESVKKGEPNLIPYENSKLGNFRNVLLHYGFEEIAGSNIPGAIKLDDANLKVVNQYQSEEYKSFVGLMREWNQKGFFRKDAATLADTSADRKAGKYAVLAGGTVKPGGEVEIKALTGKDTLMLPTSKSYLTTGGIIATMTGVSKSSKNPERAVMLLDLIFKDKQLYNMLAHGIEGKHYKKINENTVEAIKDGGYDPNTDWEFGNQFNGYYRSGQKPGIWEETVKLNETAANSPALGFSFDPTPVKSEIAQSSTVSQQYAAMLETGSVDPAQILPEFLDKLKKAGSDVIIAEQQKQLDAWKLANKK